MISLGRLLRTGKCNGVGLSGVTRHWQRQLPLISSSLSSTTVTAAASSLFDDETYFAPTVVPRLLPLPTQDAALEPFRRSLALRGRSLDFDLLSLAENQSQLQALDDEVQRLNKTLKKLKKEHASMSAVELQAAAVLRKRFVALRAQRAPLYPLVMRRALSLPCLLDEVAQDLPTLAELPAAQQLPADAGEEWCPAAGPCPRYLRGVSAELDMRSADRAFDMALSRRCIALAGSDLVRTPLVEACGLLAAAAPLRLQPHWDVGQKEGRFNPYAVNYLMGSASLPAMAAFLLRGRVAVARSLPLRLVSHGRVYRAVGNHVEQHIQVAVMHLASSEQKAADGRKELCQLVHDFWAEQLPDQARCEGQLAPPQLLECESQRLCILSSDSDVSMATAAAPPVLLGAVSSLRDFLSRRLVIESSDKAPLWLTHAVLYNSSALPILFKHQQPEIK